MKASSVHQLGFYKMEFGSFVSQFIARKILIYVLHVLFVFDWNKNSFIERY